MFSHLKTSLRAGFFINKVTANGNLYYVVAFNNTNSIKYVIDLSAEKTNESDALIEVTSCSNCKINNEASICFSKLKWLGGDFNKQK